MPFEERQQVVEDFKAGHVRVLIVTDTATYGFDAPNLAVLADLPTSKADKDQKVGRAGRDGLPSVVVAFAPPWMIEPVGGVDPTNPKHLADLEKRSKLPHSLVQWYNPTAEKCCRAITMEQNGEVFVRRSNCCIVCNPDGSDTHLAEVAKWQQYFLAKQPVASEPRIRSDGTFHALEKPMKESLEQMLDRWRHRIWAQIRTSRDEPCEYFLPEHVLQAIVNKAHVCTSMDRLKTVAGGWEYADSHGGMLLNYLKEALLGFNQIFQDRKAAEGIPSDSENEDTAPTGAELLENTTLAVLHSFCREFNLSRSGNKSVVVDRLIQYFVS
ncbi:p-loop containing nucleoside triphosphate hydrolase protein [Favolaschia claudopus]|uniref:P-loop containing nucleoside triphosphate hydrolase protein n=1 Tax=Favolaschia claudopus TaxID=2862362 RepID=A0AAW0B7C3_9AGAR